MNFAFRLVWRLCVLFIGSDCIAQVAADAGSPGKERADVQAVIPTAAAAVAVPQDYVLRSNDAVSVTVFQEPELNCTERIAADGTIAVPMIGRIQISGRSPIKAAEVIRDALKKYLVSPQVNLSVTEATKEYFTLLGQVASPGNYVIPTTHDLSLLMAVGMAGGFTEKANPGKITIKRQVGSKETFIRVDGKKLAGERGKTTFIVLPGDIITVGEIFF